MPEFSQEDMDAALQELLQADVISITVNDDGEFTFFMTDEQRARAEDLWRDDD
jgi:hypothetical protein